MRRGRALRVRGIVLALTFAGAGMLQAQVVVDDLTDGKTRGTVAGGTLSSRGWSPVSGKNSIRYNFGKAVAAGGAQVWVTNFNPLSQSKAEKHHIFSGKETESSANEIDWARWRCGTNYPDPGRSATMKVLTKNHPNSQDEKGLILANKNYDLAVTYRLKTTWNAGGTVEYFFDGQKVYSVNVGSGFNIGLQFVGDDNLPAAGGSYGTLIGPCYTKIVLWVGSEPSSLESLRESATAASPAIMRIHQTASGAHDNSLPTLLLSGRVATGARHCVAPMITTGFSRASSSSVCLRIGRAAGMASNAPGSSSSDPIQ